MEQMKIAILLIILITVKATNAFAHDIEVPNDNDVIIYYNFINNGTELSVTCRGSAFEYTNEYTGNVVIPETVSYNGNIYSVTSIGGYAFYVCSGLTSVVIPNSVTSIRDMAFSGCSGLTSVVIPNSVTSIGWDAFSGCSGLTAVVIPNSVTSIEAGAFQNCSGLTSVVIPNSVTSIGENAFSGSTWYLNQSNGLLYLDNWLIGYKENKPIGEIVIAEGTKGIANGAFRDCSGMTSVVIPNSVTSIGSDAFSGCSGLTNVIIPNSVTSIEAGAFYGCSGLTSVVIPNSVTSIGWGAYRECSGLTSVVIPNSVTSIGERAFWYCKSLASVTIGSGIVFIGSNAFYNCYRLHTIYCLNPIPPTAENSVFFCKDNVRDPYDVYTYATLHVPMGSGEVYGSAYEWRYFNKIKEDMEADGRVYYANLTVQQGTTGFTRQAIKASEKYTIYIGSLGQNRVNAVTFNGVDVTDQVANGYYTTPEIKGESVLSVSYETTTSARALTLENVKVTGYNGEITIQHIDEPSDVSVYSVDGKLIESIPEAFGSANVQVPAEQLYIVKVGSRTYKVAL